MEFPKLLIVLLQQVAGRRDLLLTMSRRKLENKNLSGLLATSLHTPIKTENFHNYYVLESKELGR